MDQEIQQSFPIYMILFITMEISSRTGRNFVFCIEGDFLIYVTDRAYTYMSSEDFIEQYRDQIESGIIQQASEHEIHHTAKKFAGIAQLFSSYETELITREDTLNNRGINSIQLLQSDEQWKIASIIWYDETDESHT